jgi:hypothetical protein
MRPSSCLVWQAVPPQNSEEDKTESRQTSGLIYNHKTDQVMEPSINSKMPVKGVIYALLAALLFGITTPFAKGLLIEISPVLLAGLFYLGSGIGLGIYLLTTQLAARLLVKKKAVKPLYKRQTYRG